MPPPASPLSPSPAGFPRLALAASWSLLVMVVCWGALQVRSAREETRRALASVPPAAAVPEGGGAAIAELERRLAVAESGRSKAEESAAAREKELQLVITFLRQENEAAQKTIERLSSIEGSTPAGAPVKPGAGGKSQVP